PRAIADGPSRAPRAQSQRAGIWSCGAAPGKEPADGAITRLGGGELAASVGGELVVAAAGAAFLARRVVFLPAGGDEAHGLKTAQCRIDRAARQLGDFHDVEPEAVALCDRLQHEEAGERQR